MKKMYLLIFIMTVTMVSMSQATSTLPASITSQTHVHLSKVGSGTYRKYGFRIYSATLWAPNGVWSEDEPYALELKYFRDLSKDTLMDNVSDDIKEQGVADDETVSKWMDSIFKTLPDINEGDTLIGLSVPNKKSELFYNGVKILTIDDEMLSKSFFDIWLGDTADEDLRQSLIGTNK